jgi:hypothetical protein
MDVERRDVPRPMKQIEFAGDNHFEGTVQGSKGNTIRRYDPSRHDLKEGELFIGKFTKAEVLLVLQATRDTDVKRFGELTEEDLEANGFSNIKEALDIMREYYPDINWNTRMGVIYYHIPEINGVPVIRPTE